MKRSIRFAALALLVTIPALAGMVSGWSATQVATTNKVLFNAHPVGRVDWIEARSVLPSASTITVSRIYSSGTDVVATVVCTNGVGRGPANTNTWYVISNEYFQWAGPTSANVRVIVSGVP